MSLCDWHYSHLTSVYKQLNLSKYPTPVRALVVNTSELETRTYFDCWICHCVERYLFDNPTKNLYYTFSAKSQNSRECRIAVNTAAPAVEYPEDFFDEGNTFVRTSCKFILQSKFEGRKERADLCVSSTEIGGYADHLWDLSGL